MKRAIFVVLLMIGVGGCSSVELIQGEPREEYHPQKIGDVRDGEGATIKVADTLYIWKVDDQELIGSFKRNLAVGQKPDSVIVTEGKHTLFLGKVGTRYSLSLQAFASKAGHEYLVEYIEKLESNRGQIHYWVRDLTTGEVVYGKEFRKQDLGGK